MWSSSATGSALDTGSPESRRFRPSLSGVPVTDSGRPWDTSDLHANWDGYFIPGTEVLRNKLDLRSDGALRDAENDLVEARIAELRASPTIVRRTYDIAHLKAIHGHLFQDVYEWAGELRTAGIAKGGESFVPPLNIFQPLLHVTARIEESHRLTEFADADAPAEIAYLYDYVNYAHPFREGNGRTQREFFDQLLAESGRGLDWSRIDVTRLHGACHQARAEHDSSISGLVELFTAILTNDPAY